MQTVANRLRAKIEKLNDSFEPSPVVDENAETQLPSKNADENQDSALHGHWKYTGFKDTIENAWRPRDPEKQFPRNVDLVDDKQKLKQLDEAIKICSKKLVESKANKPWMHVGPKDTIENMYHVDYVREWVKPKYSPQVENSDEEYGELEAPKSTEGDGDKPARNHPSVPKFNVKDKTRMYEKDYSEIRKYPWNFKYDEFLEDDESDEDLRGLGAMNNGGRRNKPKKNRTPSEVTPDETISVGEDFGF